MNYEMFDKFDDQTLRVSDTIIFPFCVSQETMSQPLEDFLQEDLQDMDEQFFKEFPAMEKINTHFTNRRVDLVEAAYLLIDEEKYGFLIKAETPVKSYYASGGASYSWGHYATKWIFAEDINTALQRAVDWADGLAVAGRKGAKP